jgi:hypothetical protein
MEAGRERCHRQHRAIGRCAFEQVQGNLTASPWAAVDDAGVFAVRRAAKFFGHAAGADVARAARWEAVEHFDLLNGQAALCPGLLEGGAAQNGRSDGGLNEFASVAHGCLL